MAIKGSAILLSQRGCIVWVGKPGLRLNYRVIQSPFSARLKQQFFWYRTSRSCGLEYCRLALWGEPGGEEYPSPIKIYVYMYIKTDRSQCLYPFVSRKALGAYTRMCSKN